MKKILSIVLILGCMLALCSCGWIKDKLGMGGDDGSSVAGLETFESAIANTNASFVKMESKVTTDIGDLDSSITVTYNNDGSATIEYTYDKFNLIGEGAEDKLESIVNGTILRAADGTYSGDIPEGLDVSGVSASPAISFAAVKDSTTVNEAGDVLTAIVPASASADVYGSALSFDSTLEISIKNNVVTFIEITFEGGFINYQYN